MNKVLDTLGPSGNGNPWDLIKAIVYALILGILAATAKVSSPLSMLIFLAVLGLVCFIALRPYAARLRHP